MAQPTLQSVQAIDPVLTNLAIGYMQDESRFIASKLFPYVPIDKANGTYYSFDKKYWFTDEMKERVPGTNFARTGYGLSTGTVKTIQWALEHAIPDEIRENSQVPMDLEEAGTRFIAQKNLLRMEIQFSGDVFANSVWGTTDNAATAKWNNYTTSDPVTDVLKAKRTIANNTGMDGNTMALGYFVHQSLMNHPDIIDRVKYTQMATASNMENAMASLFGFDNYYVGKATYTNTNEATAFSASSIIGNNALIAYVAGGPGIFTASAGYMFTWQPGGGQGTVYRVRDDQRHADLIQLACQWQDKVVATDCGYLYLTVVS